MKRLVTFLTVTLLGLGSINAQTPGENFDVTHYEIHLNNLDFTNHTLQGETFVTVTTTAPTNTFVLELKGVTLSAATCVEHSLNNSLQEDDHIVLVTDATIPAGETLTFDITYSGNTFNESWGGIQWSGNATNGYYVCNMGVGMETIPHNLGKTWFPCVDNFTDKASYDIFVTVDNDQEAICGGNFINTLDNGNGTSTWHWQIPQELATYQVSFAAGDYVEWTDTYNGMERDIPITVYVKPSQINNVPGTFVHIKDIAGFLEECFGPYPFNRIGYVITSVGCMEHVDNIGIVSSILTGNTTYEDYLPHELSHMWFGNKVTCASAEEMWLNEGFAQFCGWYNHAALYGDDNFQQVMRPKINSIARWCKSEANWIPLNNVPQEMTYDGDAVYDRGAVIVNTLMNYLGKDTFYEGLRSYLNTYSYSAATSEQLRDALTAATGIDMNGFFDTYVFTAGMPHYGVDLLNVTQNGNQYQASVRMTYQHVGPSHVGQNNRVEVTFVDHNGHTQTAMVGWDGLEATQTVMLDIEPIAAFVDYDNHFLDAKQDKNSIATSTISLSQDNFTAKVTSVSDSTMLRIEDHYIAPDNDPGIPGLTLSTCHYWNFFRNDFGEATVAAQIKFSNAMNVDGDIIHTENDSAVLLYRANAFDTWHTLIPDLQEGLWRLGRFTINNAQSGQYTIGVIDKSTLSITEQYADQKLFPNPANDQVTLRWDGKHNGTIRVYNQSLQLVKTVPFHQTDKMTFSVEGLASGLYFVECDHVMHKLIIK